MEHLDLLKGVILPYVNFAIFAVLAVFFLRKPLVGMAKKRRETFQLSLRDAQKAYDEALRRMNDIKTRLDELQKEVDEIKVRTREQSEREATDMIAEAKQLAEHLTVEARRIAEAEVATAKSALRREIVEAVRQKLETDLRTAITAKKQQDIVRDRIAELNKMKVEV